MWSAIVCAATFTTCAAAAPQTQQPYDPNMPIFPWLFPSPTNNNGYEEFVRAADLVKNIPEINTALNEPLEYKRRVLNMSACIKALSILREGVAKQVKSPRPTFDENTLFPELAEFRKLGRLMVTEQYVDFADGRVDAAIESLRVGLTFSYQIQTDAFISGLVGIAINSMVIKEFAAHFEQLSIYNCDDILVFARQLLSADSPAGRLIEKEKAQALQLLDKQRGNANGLLGILADFDDSDPPALPPNELRTSLGGSPGSVGPIIDAAEARVRALYDQAAANTRLPLSLRVPLNAAKGNTPADTLCRAITADPQNIIDRYGSDQARIRLLAVHVLIRRYRWDHNALPASLSDLRADDLTIDPFTGTPLVYKRDVDTYTLSSAGPFKRDDTTGETTPARDPVKLR